MSSDVTAGKTPDLYGQVHPDETDEMVAAKLQALDEQVAKLLLTDNKKDASLEPLRQAQIKCPHLLTRDFKLMFLRCEVFNADLAAKRYAHYWEKRVEICGPEKAFQPLTLATDGPLHDDGDTALAIGFLNYVEGPADAAGRGVLVVFPGHQDRTQYTRPAMARAAWYIIHALLDSSPTVQKHGLLFLAHPHGAKFGQFDRALMKIMLGSIQGALPVRLSAFHICQPPPFFKIILPIAKLFMTERTKKRLNVHFGSPAEICHKLTNTFGMHKECIPEALGGTLTIDMAAWVAQRRAEGK